MTSAPDAPDAPDTIVLIHGLWMTPLAWEHWVERYQARGFTVLTPGYPGIGQGQAGLTELRANPDAVAGTGVREIMDHLTAVIEDLPAPPVIMGHSFGGTFAQLLIGHGLGTAGICIDSAPVKGINTTPLTEARSVLPALDNPANINKASTLTPKQFHYAFTNTQDDAAAQHAYDRYSAPTPAKVLFQGGFAALTPHASTTFNFADDNRAPLLFISGGADHILPPVIQDHNYKKCAKHSTATTARKLFPGRDHYTCGEPGWEAVADLALNWALAPIAGELDAS
jgi:pimeloyl-ACP methyl ester carboxylesterase